MLQKLIYKTYPTELTHAKYKVFFFLQDEIFRYTKFLCGDSWNPQRIAICMHDNHNRGRQILFTNYSVLMNGIFCHTQRLQFFKVHLTWLTARCIIHANYNPLSFVTMSALAYFLHFCAVESTLTRCMSLSFTFEFLFPKIWDRSLLVIHPLNREPIYQQPLRMIAYWHAFQFGMNNEWQFVLNKRIMALEGREGGTWASTFFLVCAAGLIEFLT